MKLTITLIAVTLLFFGCKKENIFSIRGERFIYNFYPNLQACQDAYPDLQILWDCSMQIAFETDGRLNMKLPDGFWTGVWSRHGNFIYIKLGLSRYIPEEPLMILKDQNTLEYKGVTFKRLKGPTFWDLYE